MSINISNIKKLDKFEDFKKVFNTVFSEFPFFESWTEEEIRETYNLNQREGIIFGYYNGEDCLGFISMRNHHQYEHPIDFKGKKSIYISHIAVLPKYRHNGIASALVPYALDFATNLGYEYAYLRLNDDFPMGLGIAKRNEFVRDFKVCQEVTHSRTHRRSRKPDDLRVFMFKEL